MLTINNIVITNTSMTIVHVILIITLHASVPQLCGSYNKTPPESQALGGVSRNLVSLAPCGVPY